MTDTATVPRTHASMRAASDRRIITAAIEAFADRGYHRTTLKQIGEAAGYTGTLISRRYGSKAALARVVFTHILGRLTPVGDEEQPDSWVLPDVSARRQLDSFVRRYLRDAADEPARLRALYVLIGESLGGMGEIDDEVAHVNRVFRDHLAAYVSLGQHQGEFRPDLDADQVAVIIVGTLRGVVTQILAEPGRFDLDALTVELRRQIIVPLLPDAADDQTSTTTSTRGEP